MDRPITIRSRLATAGRASLTLITMVMLSVILSGCEGWPFEETTPSSHQRARPPSMFERGPKACATACAVASASRHELTLLFGSEGLPAELEWGRVYVDQAGFSSFAQCVGTRSPEREILAECQEKAHSSCITACEIGEKARMVRERDRHSGRDTARKQARQKKPSR